MKIINNKKGAALLWCILLVVILTILLGSITTAVYAYFNYTMNTVMRQQAYFTARSAINVVLENLSSVEQAKETTTSDTATSTGKTMNYDGNYIYDADGDGCKDIVDGSGKVLYYGSNQDHNTFTSTKEKNDTGIFDKDGYLIEDYTYSEWSLWKGTTKTNYTVRTNLVMRAVTSTGSSYTQGSSAIDLLPAQNSTVTVTDFGFDSSMGKASATIYRDDSDKITISVTSYYPDENGKKYTLEASVIRQPVYFGGIAIKNLTLNGNLTLGEGTDLYWNNTAEFNTLGNGSSFKNNGNYKLTVTGNLVTKGNATITAGNIVAGKLFTGTAKFTNSDLSQKKIWNPSQYIISNKSLLVGDTGTDYSTSTYGSLSSFFSGDVHYEYCNSRGSKNAFGGLISEFTNATSLLNFFDYIGLSNAYDGMQDENYALKNDDSDAMAIQYIEILSLTNSVNQAFENMKKDASVLETIIASIGEKIYSTLTDAYSYDYLDVSYIDYSSTDENNRSDEVVPLTYIKVPSGINIRVRYGCDPGNRTTLGKFVENVTDNVESFLAKAFDINSNAAYNVVYLEDNSTVELGWNKDGRRNINGNKAANVFYYSIYGGDGTKVILYDNVILVGEIVCEDLEIYGNARVIYSSTNGSQVAKQKVAEYWTVSNYSD